MNPGVRTVRCMVAVAVCGLAPAAFATKLDNAACAALTDERNAITATGVKADMERGPEWAKANMPPERLQSALRLLEVEDQLEFRCGRRGKSAKPEQTVAPATPPTPATGMPAAAVKNSAQDNAQDSTKDSKQGDRAVTAARRAGAARRPEEHQCSADAGADHPTAGCHEAGACRAGPAHATDLGGATCGRSVVAAGQSGERAGGRLRCRRTRGTGRPGNVRREYSDAAGASRRRHAAGCRAGDRSGAQPTGNRRSHRPDTRWRGRRRAWGQEPSGGGAQEETQPEQRLCAARRRQPVFPARHAITPVSRPRGVDP